MILLSGAGLGFNKSRELGNRKKHLEMLMRMIILLKGEIRLCTMPLPELPANWRESTENFF